MTENLNHQDNDLANNYAFAEQIRGRLHDSLNLIGMMRMTAELVNYRLEQGENNSDEVKFLLAEMGEHLGSLYSQLRLIFLDLPDRRYDQRPLSEATFDYTSSVQKMVEVDFDTRIDKEVDEASPDLQKAIFTIYRESISNAVRHAKAAKITIRLSRTKSGYEVEVSDDGQGFNVESQKMGYGISRIRQLVGSLNGKLEIESSKERGTKLFVYVPDSI